MGDPLSKCLTYNNVNSYLGIDTNMDYCNGLANTICKRRLGLSVIRYQTYLIFLNPVPGYGTFPLFEDRNVKAHLETSGDDEESAQSLSLGVCIFISN